MNSPDSHLDRLLEEIRQAVNPKPSSSKTVQLFNRQVIKKPVVDPLLDELLNRLNQ